MLVKQIQVVKEVSSAFLRFEVLSFRIPVDTKLENQDSKPKRNDRRGFTLVEVIVILAVIGILAAVAVPMALRVFERTAEEATREEMDNLRRALIGDSRKLQTSFRSDFGFLGDIGCLPTTLDRLLTIGTLPAWSFDTTKQTGAGWKGPYITGAATGEETEEYTKDQLGNDYDYTASGACPLTATLTSNGPDGQLGTADDIILDVLASETTATVRGKVKDMGGAGLGSTPVEFYSANNGALPASPPTATTDANGEYVFTSVPYGHRAVRAIPAALLYLVSGSVFTENDGEDVFFKVVNYSGTAITITHMTTLWAPDNGERYDDIFINKVAVDNGNNFDSGETENIDDTTFSANAAPSASMRVVVDSPDTQLPDINLSSGTTATIQFEFDNNDDMRGSTITVVFTHSSGGPSTVTFTP